MLTFNGKPFDPDDFQEALMDAAVVQVKEHLHERISSIRHPVTGEFPTVVVSGESLDTISARIEGSTEMLGIVRERLNPDDLEGMTLVETEKTKRPKAFLSYAWEDKLLASRIAETLQANGIDTWWAEWEIRAGDSLRRKIDEGLGTCTHFLVLLTPTSIIKPWVNQEMDAGLVRKIESEAQFIALRSNLEANALPPLLRGLLSPAISKFDEDIKQLIHDIHGLSSKPPLGPAPPMANFANTGYSAAATAIAKVFVEASKNGGIWDPTLSVSELCDQTSLSREDVMDGVYELGSMVSENFDTIVPSPNLFATFDKHFMEWDPAKDALALATDLLNDESFPREPDQIAERYGWKPRRLNPTIAYLTSRKLVASMSLMSMGPWIAVHLENIDATRRFVKSRQ